MPIWPREPDEDPRDHVGVDPARQLSRRPNAATSPTRCSAPHGARRSRRRASFCSTCSSRSTTPSSEDAMTERRDHRLTTTSAPSPRPSPTCSTSAAVVLAGAERRRRACSTSPTSHAPRPKPAWVYEHAAELGAFRFGNGPKARIGFDLDADRAVEARTPDRQASSRATEAVAGQREVVRREPDPVRAVAQGRSIEAKRALNLIVTTEDRTP